ncbi:NAD(P)H-dependent oxidoreductase [Streptomyces europaeiscabiei]|uniref:NADPH-dependent FMN reductase n=1 Tax=Streptomyces europaeiscabiei TaxID=146819 RepID=UPI0029A34ED3|nr:NAD(P)H-dependent oxidoreductase [Streptomyces europaeiscabiei]MDX3696552.1 NAD(P)H-dependent oxidoreductase [Streptomyces europaeiscabiei]
MRTTIVVGNPKPASRTRQVAEALLDRLVKDDADRHVIDLAEYSAQIFEWPSEVMSALNERVAGSDLVVIASPTYKATYTGLLKAFLDRYAAGALTGVTAIPVMTGADLGHSMGVDTHLAPLLTELGAVVPGRGWYFVTSSMDRLDPLADEAAARYAQTIRQIARLAEGAMIP